MRLVILMRGLPRRWQVRDGPRILIGDRDQTMAAAAGIAFLILVHEGGTASRSPALPVGQDRPGGGEPGLAPASVTQLGAQRCHQPPAGVRGSGPVQ